MLVDNVEQPYFQQLMWAGMIVNAYLPRTVFPTSLSAEGLPIGLSESAIITEEMALRNSESIRSWRLAIPALLVGAGHLEVMVVEFGRSVSEPGAGF